MINIRKLLPSDYKKFLKLIQDFRETDFTHEQFLYTLEVIKPNSCIWVLEDDNTKDLLATGTLITETKFIFNICTLAHIEDVCVKYAFRGNGYGKMIIQHLIDEAKKKKCYKIVLSCADYNKEFYIKCGFEERGLNMSKLLTEPM